MAARSPASGNRNVTVLFQGTARNVLPGYSYRIARTGDREGWHAGSLDERNHAPKSAGHGISPAVHGAARVGLADGAVELAGSICAGPAATGNFMPIHAVTLGIGGEHSA